MDDKANKKAYPASGQGDVLVISPAMVSAGVLAFERWSGSADEYFLVEQVYIAMKKTESLAAFSSRPRRRTKVRGKLQGVQKSS